MHQIQRDSENDAFAWADIQTNMQQISDLSIDLSDLEWKVDDLILREAESEQLEPWELDDIKARLVAVETLGWSNPVDDEWQMDDLERRLTVLETTVANEEDFSWQIDDLTRQVNELQWSSGNSDDQWQIDQLYDELYHAGGRIDVLWSVLESREWARELLQSLGG